MNRVYTEATDNLRKLFDDYKGFKSGKSSTAIFFDNTDGGDITGHLSAMAGSEDYYISKSYKQVSEQEFIDIIGFEKSNDNVRPSHYTNLSIEPVDYIDANGLDFNEGNVIKYVSRHRNKNGLEDLKKARFYLERLICNYEK